MKKTTKRMGRPPKDPADKVKYVLITLTPARRAVVEALGDGHPQTGIYRLIDTAAKRTKAKS